MFKYFNSRLYFFGQNLKKNFYFIQKRLLKSFVHSSVNCRQLGIDRIINVLSVNHLFPNKEDFIIIDLGTATTLDIVKKNKYFDI